MPNLKIVELILLHPSKYKQIVIVDDSKLYSTNTTMRGMETNTKKYDTEHYKSIYNTPNNNIMNNKPLYEQDNKSPHITP